MKRLIHILFQILTTATIVAAQNNLECSINFPDTLILGQSMYFEYSIHNTSQNSSSVFYDPSGQNFNNFRRDESFNIKVYGLNNELLPIKKSKQDEIIAYSRRIGFHELLTGDSLVYVLWIDNWFDLDLPGEYTLECSKEFRIRIDEKDEIKETAKCSRKFHVRSCDSITMAKKVHQIWMNATEKKIEPPLQDNQSHKEFQDQTNQGMQNYYYRQNQLKLLCRLKSKQIIPYLDEIMSLSKSTKDIVLAMEGLSKFNKDKEVFSIISKPFQYEGIRFVDRGARELERLLSYLKFSSLAYLSKFEDSLLIPFMLEHQNDKSQSVRLDIMQQLYRKNSKYSFDNLKVNLNDSNATIRSEASRLLKMYQRKKKE